MVLAVFGSLLFLVIAFQLYRGVVAFRHPEREISRPKKTPWLLWLLAAFVFLVVFIGAAFVGARFYGP